MITVAVALLLAANAVTPGTTDVTQLQADVARLQQELREQKQLLLQFMQVDQQRYDMLLQIIRSSQGGPPSASAVPSMPSLPSTAVPAPAVGPETVEKAIKAGSGTISGRVRLPKEASDVY